MESPKILLGYLQIERRRREAHLGGSGGMPPPENFWNEMLSDVFWGYLRSF